MCQFHFNLSIAFGIPLIMHSSAFLVHYLLCILYVFFGPVFVSHFTPLHCCCCVAASGFWLWWWEFAREVEFTYNSRRSLQKSCDELNLKWLFFVAFVCHFVLEKYEVYSSFILLTLTCLQVYQVPFKTTVTNIFERSNQQSLAYKIANEKRAYNF